MANKIDSNLTGGAYAEEDSLGVVSGTAKWYELEPNSWGDFGAENSTEARNPITATRKNRKGAVVDKEVTAGVTQDLTHNNMLRLFEGFFFCDVDMKPSNLDFDKATGVSLSEIAANGDLVFESDVSAIFAADDIITIIDATNNVNNTTVTVSSVSTATVSTNGSFVAESPSANQVLVVKSGVSGVSADIVNSASQISLTVSLTGITLNAGEWVFIKAGSESAYGRVKSHSGGVVVLDETTSNITDGSAVSCDIYFGYFFADPSDATDIVTHSYQFERTLGEDDDGVQSQYEIGCVANEMTLSFPTTAKLTAEISFVGIDEELRTGLEGKKSGTRVSALGEDAINSSNHIFRSRIAVADPSDLNNAALFGYVRESELSISNNVTGLKALGTSGSFDISVGSFDVSGSITAYFTSVDAISKINDYEDIEYNVILSSDNQGMVWDIPLLGLSGGRLSVEQDDAVTIPVELMGGVSSYGHTLSLTKFPYLPAEAMA